MVLVIFVVDLITTLLATSRKTEQKSCYIWNTILWRIGILANVNVLVWNKTLIWNFTFPFIAKKFHEPIKMAV